MLRGLVVSGALATGANRVARAQAVCWAATRDIAALSPRSRLADMSLPGQPFRDVIADGTGCALRPEQLIGAYANIAGVDINLSIQPLTVRGSILGGLPDARDNGPSWTGRGANAFARTGVSLDVGHVHFIGAPQVWYAQNTAFDVMPSTIPSRSPFASPWYGPPFSIDLPSRLGVKPITELDPGESSAWINAGPVDAGVSTSTQQWGPGERGNLILGPDAPGIPRIFLRTAHAIDTPIGSFGATAFVGTLTASRFFLTDSANQLRSLTAWNVAWSPGDSSTFVAGVAHATMQLGARFDGSSQPLRGPKDGINEVYFQFRDPRTGIRAWTEIGHQGGISGVRQLVTIPYQGLAYIVGLDRAILRRSNVLLLSAEATDLEQPTDIRGVTAQDFYTSSDIAAGWTQRGMLLGYPTGPGSQEQWLSGDWIANRWSAGVFAERVRWNEDALFRQYLPYPNRHDVTVRAGVRGGIVVFDTELALEASIGKRLNYLFQDDMFIPGYRTVDVSVPQLRFTLTPAAHGRP
jgi:hypothetical protein